MELDTAAIRSQFPILTREVRPGVPLVYMDSAATSQKPRAVIAAMDGFYERTNANIHRGVHTLAEEATALYESARERIARFIGAASTREVVFTRGTTESINLVAHTWARANLKAGDLVVLTEMEHHSNLVPWHMLVSEMGVQLEFVPITPEGLLDLEAYRTLLSRNPKLVAFVHASNVLGTINPAVEMIRLAHQVGAVTLVDAAQSAPHFPLSVSEIQADFIAFSAHKMCGPTGIGVLYGKEDLLEGMPPFLGGGDMIREVKLRSFRANSLPHKFEAGTPAIAEAVGFGAAIDYLSSLGMAAVEKHERDIVNYALERLASFEWLRVLGPAAKYRSGVVAFAMDGVHPHDVAQLLDSRGIAVRAGHHCAQPLHERLNLPASTRASFYLYSTRSEVDALVAGLQHVHRLMA